MSSAISYTHMWIYTECEHLGISRCTLRADEDGPKNMEVEVCSCEGDETLPKRPPMDNDGRAPRCVWGVSTWKQRLKGPKEDAVGEDAEGNCCVFKAEPRVA